MRRRQILAQKSAKEESNKLAEGERQMGIKVPNSNLISKNAQPALKEKANMFLPHEGDITKVNGSPFRKQGSKSKKSK